MNKIIISILFFIIVLGNIYSQEIIEIPTTIVGDLGLDYYHSIRTKILGTKIYYKYRSITDTSNPDGYASFDIETKEIHVFDKFNEFDEIFGQVNGELIVSRMYEHNIKNIPDSYDTDVFLFNQKKDTYNRFNDYLYQWKYDIPNYFLFHHYNGSKYIAVYNLGDEAGYRSALYDRDTGEREEIKDIKGIYDISEDKLHGLIFDESRHNVYLYSFVENKIIGNTKESANIVSFETAYFLTNDLFLVQIHSRKYAVINLGLQIVVYLDYLMPDDGKYGDEITKILGTSFATIRLIEGRYNKSTLLVQCQGELEALNSLGLLFKSSTGTANDSRVRIREWPLLDAKHLGYLTTGDQLEILDRSGIKVKIGDMEDYWYKLMRVSDGMEGWSYGAFIDLDEE